jgi:hypothetical protein
MPKEQKQKKYYTVEVECLIPAVAKYRVLVDEDDYDKAVLGTIKIVPSETPRLQLGRMKRLSAKVYEYGTNMMKFIKKF